MGSVARIVVLAALLAACGTQLDIGGGRPPPAGAEPPPECRAQSCDFVGEGTFAGLGLVGQSRAELPDPNRPAMIWVTHDLLPFDDGGPGGPVEGTRMMCFEFADGSGGTDWPIDPGWRPPGALDAAASPDVPVSRMEPLALLALLALLIVGVLLAFRRR